MPWVYHGFEFMETQEAKRKAHYESNAFLRGLFVSLVLGLSIGALLSAFLKALELVELQHAFWNSEKWPVHVFLIPIVLGFLYLLKKRTLYFPSKISELTAWSSESCWQWSAWMAPFKFLGTLLSHIAGASVGREGVAVVMSAGLARIFRLPWNFWGPVTMGAGFAAIVGNPWIGFVFVTEMFRTNLRQKLFTLISSYVSYLLMQTLNVPHFIPKIEIELDIGFFKTLSFVMTLAISVGYIMRFYKWVYFRLSDFFTKRSFWLRFALSFVLMGLMTIPEFRKFQSLGISQLQDLTTLKIGFEIPFLKLIVTLFSLVLGFWGGEFIPLIYTGLHFGASLASLFDFPLLVGAYLGCYLFFASATRLKWTVFFLILGLMGFSWCLWLLVLINICVGFSGDESLYFTNE